MRLRLTVSIFTFLIGILLTPKASNGQSFTSRDTVQGVFAQFELEDRLEALTNAIKTTKSHAPLQDMKEEYRQVAYKFELAADSGKYEKQYVELGIYVERGKWLQNYRAELEKTGKQLDSLDNYIKQNIPVNLDETSYVSLRWHMGTATQNKPKPEQKAFEEMVPLEAQVLDITNAKRDRFLTTGDTTGFSEEEVMLFDEWLNAIEKWKKTREKAVLSAGRGLEVPIEINFRRRTLYNEKGKKVAYWGIEGVYPDTREVEDSRFRIERDFEITREKMIETIEITFTIIRMEFEFEGERIPEEMVTIKWAVQVAKLEDGKTYTRFDLSPEAINHYPLGKYGDDKKQIYFYHDMLDARAFYPHKISKYWRYIE